MLFFPHPSSETWNDEEYECDVDRGCAKKRLPHISLMSGYYNWQERERKHGVGVSESPLGDGVCHGQVLVGTPQQQERILLRRRGFLFSLQSHTACARAHTLSHTHTHTHTHTLHTRVASFLNEAAFKESLTSSAAAFNALTAPRYFFLQQFLVGRSLEAATVVEDEWKFKK